MRFAEILDDALLEGPKDLSPTQLWVSDVGRCPRKAMYRVLGGYEVTHPFDLDLLDVMQLGRFLEDATAELLAKRLGARNVERDVRLGNKLWSGVADFLTQTEEGVAVVEHKATGAKWFDYQANLPKPQHAAQALTYQRLFAEEHGVRPACYLFYRAWRKRAEFELSDEGNYVMARGYVARGGEMVYRRRNVNVEEARHFLERCYEEQVLPEKPWYSPLELGAECAFQGEPSCLYYGHCWE